MSAEITPTQVAGASFRTTRKGYDPDEVDAFLERAAKALEEAQQQAASMEARARAAVARLQELTAAQEQAASQEVAAPAPQPVAVVEAPPVDEVVRVAPDEAETITRTLLLAQRTADRAVAEAQADADRIRHEARVEAESTIDSTREMSARLLEDARIEARRHGEAERVAVENEVQSLVARREFLIGDVDQLERFLVDQRERMRAAARQLEALCDRVPAGFGHVRAPALSAADSPPGDDTAEQFRPRDVAAIDIGDELEPPRSQLGLPTAAAEPLALGDGRDLRSHVVFPVASGGDTGAPALEPTQELSFADGVDAEPSWDDGVEHLS